MKNENTEMKKEKKGFLSALLNRIRPDKNKDKKRRRRKKKERQRRHFLIELS